MGKINTNRCEGGGCDNSFVSRNLVSEHKHRKKRNEVLYSLRALVPKISKVSFAMVEEEQTQVLQLEVSTMLLLLVLQPPLHQTTTPTTSLLLINCT
jgi:hypothetical protein